MLGCNTCHRFAASVKQSLRAQGQDVDVRILDKKSLGLPESDETVLWGHRDPKEERWMFAPACKKPGCENGCDDELKCLRDAKKTAITGKNLMEKTRPVGKVPPPVSIPPPGKPTPPEPVVAKVQVGRQDSFETCVSTRSKRDTSCQFRPSTSGKEDEKTQ